MNTRQQLEATTTTEPWQETAIERSTTSALGSPFIGTRTTRRTSSSPGSATSFPSSSPEPIRRKRARSSKRFCRLRRRQTPGRRDPDFTSCTSSPSLLPGSFYQRPGASLGSGLTSTRLTPWRRSFFVLVAQPAPMVMKYIAICLIHYTMESSSLLRY